MQDFEMRAVGEFDQLCYRIQQLQEFQAGELFTGLSAVEQDLLQEQLVIMQRYRGVLGARIVHMIENNS